MLLIHLSNNVFKLYYCNTLLNSDLLYLNKSSFTIDVKSKENEGFVGFFDWLRSDEFTIIGIRICYFEDLLYNELLLKFPYVNSTFDGKFTEILFKGNSYSSELSGDQDFTNNYVYHSQDNDFIFTFGLDHLTENELSSLLENCEVLNEEDLLGSRYPEAGVLT